MSKIILGKRFEKERFISIRKKLDQMELQNLITETTNQYKDYLSDDKYLITTTFSVEVIGGKEIMDVEVLIPLREELNLQEPYLYKDKIRIENSLYVKLEEDVSRLNNVLANINTYIIENKLQPITTAYIVQSMNNTGVEIEIYLGLSNNLL